MQHFSRQEESSEDASENIYAIPGIAADDDFKVGVK
jgi:hypothetical protein